MYRHVIYRGACTPELSLCRGSHILRSARCCGREEDTLSGRHPGDHSDCMGLVAAPLVLNRCRSVRAPCTAKRSIKGAAGIRYRCSVTGPVRSAKYSMIPDAMHTNQNTEGLFMST